MFRDITKRKAVEARRAALERELSQAQKMEALGTLASGVAHEINTPVQYVGDNIRFMQDAFGDLTRVVAAYREALALAPNRRSVRRSRASGLWRTRSTCSSCSARCCLDRAVAAGHGPGRQHRQRDQGVLPPRRGREGRRRHQQGDRDDPDRVAQSVEVCCGGRARPRRGAADGALPAGRHQPGAAQPDRQRGRRHRGARRRPGRIAVATVLVGGEVEIRIADNGCGIPPEVAGRVFDPFFTTKDVGKGTGQGLAISYAIVRQKHGGSIGFVGRPGGGTCFTIRLPLHAASLTAEEAAT
ncbi:MAG: ATP-binding protein [Alphaproteobacteria bacterium]